jgi:hypothetical protein
VAGQNDLIIGPSGPTQVTNCQLAQLIMGPIHAKETWFCLLIQAWKLNRKLWNYMFDQKQVITQIISS